LKRWGVVVAGALLSPLLAHPPTAPYAATGLVVLQFDDGSVGHYVAADTLEAYGFRGSFGIVTGNTAKSAPWSLSPAQVVDLHVRGHEVHDHTWTHSAAGWCDSTDLWGPWCRRSLDLFAALGIAPKTGWNHPGGVGECFRVELRDTLVSYGYTYAAGRVGLTWNQQRNFHANLRDDPFSLGRGFVMSWGWNSTSYLAGSDGELDAHPVALGVASPAVSAALEVGAMKRAIARGVAQGLTSIPVFHVVSTADSTLWAVGELCRWLRAHPEIRVMRMRDAVADAQRARPLGAYNLLADLTTDRDGDGRPDGWVCTGSILPGGVVALGNGAASTAYGPSPLCESVRLSFDARATLPDWVVVQLRLDGERVQ
jgi:hypothetical protein